MLVFHMKCFSWGNWHLCLKFYWFHLNHFYFFGVDYWFLVINLSWKQQMSFISFGEGRGEGGDFLIDNNNLNNKELSRFVVHYTTKCHIVLRKCHSKTNFMRSMISVSIWACGVSLMEHWRVWRLAFCCFEGQQHNAHRLRLE
jgi:hypothetical protein